MSTSPAVAATSPAQKPKSSKKRPTSPTADQNGSIAGVAQQAKEAVTSDWDYKLSLIVLTVLAFATRFWGISHPNQVVFDEVHFGKFASHYLQRTYFFDVHPPFGKLLFALAGWFVGYNGEFLFDNIGDSYITNRVPYVAYRAMPATQGALTIPVIFLIMWECGFSLPACILSASLVLFDNAHVAQTRLILLDATLILAMALSVLAYVKFYKQRHAPFSRKWWKYLLSTGLALSCVISTKYIGVFTFFSIGVPVMIDLWALLDVNRKNGALSLPDFGKHLAARTLGLIIVPFIVYLFWFQVHFAILYRSGPGDEFMTPEFQETLAENSMAGASFGINYLDHLTIRHKETRVYLHSHLERYPLRYDDGRISSQGQQVTGYPHNDTNNHWQIMPLEGMRADGEPVRNGDIVKLRHIVTDTFLLSHDVASPYYPTNQEFTTVPGEEANAGRHNDTLFEIRVENARNGQEFKTVSSQFKLVHFPSRVTMWTHSTPLPEWAFKQAEINGNKNTMASSNIWYIEDLPSVPKNSPRLQHEDKKIKTLPFYNKWLELQRAMFYHNNALTSSHPYASFPAQWPFLIRGVSFWTDGDSRQQIYFYGNPMSWWLASALIAVFGGIVGADQLTQRRGIDALDERTRQRLYYSTGFFFLTWAAHYLPFFIMGRQLFLHHYLPAHLASALVAGAVLEFIFLVEPLTSAAGGRGATGHRPIRERIAGQNSVALWAASGVILAIVVWGFVFYAPLTYGYPALTVPEVNARKLLSTIDLHFAK